MIVLAEWEYVGASVASPIHQLQKGDPPKQGCEEAVEVKGKGERRMRKEKEGRRKNEFETERRWEIESVGK